MLTAITWIARALFIWTAMLIALTPAPGPELLTPEPVTLASLVPGWITRRRARRRQETIEEANTVTWLRKVKEQDQASLTIGVDRRGESVDVQLPSGPLQRRSVPPWAAAPVPPSKSMSMIPEHVTPVPVQLAEILPAPPEPEPEPWWMNQAEQDKPAADAPSDPKPWLVGDSADPPTIVRGLRAILDDDLGEYERGLPGYER